MTAIDHATNVNSWYENCSPSEMPPRWMWPFDDEVNQWFEEVQLARQAGSPGPDADSESMVVNEYANDLR
jgi:hypothetical protein